jgi:hypothetical protein
MAIKKFTLQQGNQIRNLEIKNNHHFGFLIGDTTIWVDGNLIGTIYDDKTLSKGAEFYLDDGSLLKIKYDYFLKWEITLNGQYAIGSWDDLDARIKLISMCLIGLAAGEFGIGVARMTHDPNLLSGSPAIDDSIFWGGINALLGIFIRRGSLTAVIIAFLFNISFIIILRFVFTDRYNLYVLDIMCAIVYLIFLILGLVTIVKLKKAK